MFALAATWIVDAVIAVTVLEAALLTAFHFRTGKGVAPGDFAINLASGLCLMMALRTSLGDGGAVPMVAWLAGAGIAHGLDIWRRWRH